MTSEYLSTDFSYKKYSLEQLDNWLFDSMNCEDLTPQDIHNTIVKCVDLLDRLDVLILLCNPDANLTGISDSINNIYENELLAEDSENDGTYKGFVLEIETRPFTDTVNQNRAVGKNKSNIIMISTEYSFASNPQVLIDELKFIIDRDDLKAY